MQDPFSSNRVNSGINTPCQTAPVSSEEKSVTIRIIIDGSDMFLFKKKTQHYTYYPFMCFDEV